MHQSGTNFRAAFFSFAVCLAASVAFIYIWYEIKPQILYTTEFIFGTVSISIALLSILVFQSFRVTIAASSLAEGIAENIMTYSHELFTELYRGSPVPYLVISRDFTVDSANLAAIRLFGIEQGWLDGKDILEFLESEEEERLPLVQQYFKKRISVNNVEVEVVRPDASRRWVMLSLFSFTDANRDHKGLLTLFDLTKQKDVDKAKTEFVSLASHQLRTPITALKWNIELLQKGGKDHFSEIETQNVEKIARSVDRMDMLVTDFLSVSKLELGTFVPHIENVPLTPFLESIIEPHEVQAATRNIKIEREWDEDAQIQADPHLLEMAVNNLISNAVKYTRTEGTVRVGSRTEGSARIIEVADTGMGIPEEEKDRIFTKIFRASNAKAEVSEGTGLGLYIARESVRVMGGDITFISDEGKGTTFTILLPQ
jgi:PAS domain S-box-containing protein